MSAQVGVFSRKWDDNGEMVVQCTLKNWSGLEVCNHCPLDQDVVNLRAPVQGEHPLCTLKISLLRQKQVLHHENIPI